MELSPLATTLLVVVLLTISSIFCAVETALLSSRKARLNQLARQGDARAKIAQKLLKQPDQMLGTILIIMTLVPIASSALTTQLMMKMFGHIGVAYGTAVLGLAVILMGEAFPKAVGTRFPEAIALAFARPMQSCVNLLYPATWAIREFNIGVLKLLGLHKKLQGNTFTEADLRGALNLGLEHGALATQQYHMLDAVLDLDNLTVADVMIHRSAIASINITTPPAELPKLLGELKHTRIMVYDGTPENLIGTLYVRDYLAALAGAPSRHQVALRPLLRPLYFVPETTPAGHQLLEFLRLHSHLALVVDEYGDIQGLISLEDILEEIVGDIPDELDAPAENPTRNADGSITLLGNTPVRDANRQYGWALPDKSAVTLAGLMVEELGHLPAQGENIILTTRTAEAESTIQLTVASKRGHKIEKIRVLPLS
jgi:Mg2+/Co2+ transporter CorB